MLADEFTAGKLLHIVRFHMLQLCEVKLFQCLLYGKARIVDAPPKLFSPAGLYIYSASFQSENPRGCLLA